MRILFTIILLTLLSSCVTESKKSSPSQDDIPPTEVQEDAFQLLLDSAQVKGSILIYDPQKNTYHSNDFDWILQGKLPASTFKITNSIIALETGVVEDENTVFEWDGQPRRMSRWERDLTLTEAFHLSCVPCYQDVARRIGVDRMNSYLSKLDYGAMQVDSTSIDTFWLIGDSRIDQVQQVDFLRRFNNSELPVAARTTSIMKRLMVIEENDDHTISGKTGWSTREGNNNGWFVGYVETDEGVYFFAVNVEPEKEFDMEMFPMIRKELGYGALRELKIIE